MISNGQLCAMTPEDRARAIDALPAGVRLKLAHLAAVGTEHQVRRAIDLIHDQQPTRAERVLRGDAARLSALAGEITAERPADTDRVLPGEGTSPPTSPLCFTHHKENDMTVAETFTATDHCTGPQKARNAIADDAFATGEGLDELRAIIRQTDTELPEQEWCEYCATEDEPFDEDDSPGMARDVVSHEIEQHLCTAQERWDPLVDVLCPEYEVLVLSCGHQLIHLVSG